MISLRRTRTNWQKAKRIFVDLEACQQAAADARALAEMTQQRVADARALADMTQQRVAQLEQQLASAQAALLTAQAGAFFQQLHAAARNLADRGDHRQIMPTDAVRLPGKAKRPLRIGLFGNLANQFFITARALRRLGHDVELVVQPNSIDAYPLSRPIWEERELEIESLDDPRLSDPSYITPDYVRQVPYDLERQKDFHNRLDAVPEVTALYRELTGRSLAPDEALVLAQWMGHWDYIKAMNDYDVVMLSMWPICLGLFSPKPYVVCPLGGDLYISGFDQDVQGLMFRASFRAADHVAVAETDYFAYLDRLETKAPRTFLPLIVDTDVYEAGVDDALRAEWQGQVGGQHFLLGVCRQSFEWKGSDRLIRAFASFSKTASGKDWRLLLQSWGDDLERSRVMVTELGLNDVTLWLSMCSKPLLRRRQRAADVVADQFVMEGYGASVLESLAAGKPVVMAPVPESAQHHFSSGPPPLVGAKTENEIAAALGSLADAKQRRAVGMASRKWVEAEHGYKLSAANYISVFVQAAAKPTRMTDRQA